ncbi:MAG: hypothetical protein FWC50_09340 [Planctomycetaceae bacterium]|nr:hypothetical protein [Planctomycetaceae bacterium]
MSILFLAGWQKAFAQKEKDLDDLLKQALTVEVGKNDESAPETVPDDTQKPVVSDEPVTEGGPAIHGTSEKKPQVKEVDEKEYEGMADDNSDPSILETTKPKPLKEVPSIQDKLTSLPKSSDLKPKGETAVPKTSDTNPKEEISPKKPEGDPNKIDASSVGCPFAPQMLKVMYDDIINGLNGRNIMGKFNMFRGYANSTLNNTRGAATGSEVNGRARLSWYDKMYRNPVESVFEVDEYSRFLHAGLSSNNCSQILQAMASMREKLDVRKREDDGVQLVQVETPDQALQEVIRCLTSAQMHYARAVAPLTQREIGTLESQLYNYTCANEIHGHTFNQNGVVAGLIDLLQKMDRGAMHDAAEALIPLSDDRLLGLLKQLDLNKYQQVLLDGQSIHQVVTPAGTILLGGFENNTYNLDGFPGWEDIVCVIDLGGNDTYREGTCNVKRPVFAIIDLEGNDTYTATKPGVQGGSVLGVSMLIDAAGNDKYTAVDVAQGSTVGGVGILIDKGGSDRYYALRRAQGQAFGGMGILIDRSGNDDYHAAMWAQGFGNPLGFGVLEDVAGSDHYYLGGLYLDSYPEHPGYEGWGQGLGAGFRGTTGSACGGIGALLDGGGDDLYEFDYIAHGGGYWLGVGFLRDFGGNDKHVGSTYLDYYGKPRGEARWQRFSNGFAVHYSLGYLFEDDGDDYYEGTIMGCGMAWDMSTAFHCDFGGTDRYKAAGGMMQGVGAEGGFGVLMNYFGNDVYEGASQGYANPNITYHDISQCGANFSFLLDYGGTDKYGCGARNNSYNQRGAAGGFLIDRPLETEPQEEAKPTPQRPQVQPQRPPQAQPRSQSQPPRPPAKR